MLYDIVLSIAYSYDSAAAASRNLLRILPRNTDVQTLITGLITVTPAPDFRRDTTDFFGNMMTEIGHDRPLTEIEFRFAGRVRSLCQPPVIDLSPPLTSLATEIAEQASLTAQAPQHYLGTSERVRPHPEVTGFARAQVTPDMTTLDAVQAVSAALHREMTFDPTATAVSTPLIEAFEARHGVCQDFSHILIAALRGIGIPAGYVSGFLRTLPPPGEERLEGADAMHAWVQAWCGAAMGWVQIDPTNDLLVGEDHVVVALGRDYADVSPVKGALRITGGRDTRHEVDMIPVDPGSVGGPPA